MSGRRFGCIVSDALSLNTFTSWKWKSNVSKFEGVGSFPVFMFFHSMAGRQVQSDGRIEDIFCVIV